MAQFLIIPDDQNLKASLALAKEYGVGFEYNDFFTPKMLDNKEELAKRINAYRNIAMPEYCTSHGDFFDVLVFSDDNRIREISEERVKQSLEVARLLDVRGVVFHTNYSPQITTEAYKKNWVNCNEEFFRGIAANYSDIEIYMENMFDTEPDLLASLAAAMDNVPNFGVCLDYAHACCFGSDINNWVQTLAPYVKHLHINDNDLKNDLHLPIGDGKIDWKQFKEYYNAYFSECSILIEVNGVRGQMLSMEYLKMLGIM